jgi:hypothetical protein
MAEVKEQTRTVFMRAARFPTPGLALEGQRGAMDLHIAEKEPYYVIRVSKDETSKVNEDSKIITLGADFFRKYYNIKSTERLHEYMKDILQDHPDHISVGGGELRTGETEVVDSRNVLAALLKELGCQKRG